MRIFFSMFLLCFVVLMVITDALYRNAWLLITVVSAVIAVILSVSYFQQEKLDALEKRLEQLEKSK